MKVLAIVLLVCAASFVSAKPQGIVQAAILDVINAAVPTFSVNPVPVAQPGFASNQPGAVSAFAAAQHNQGPSGTGFGAQTAVSG